MRDWNAFIRSRLPRLPLAPGREAEIREELGQLLEDSYGEARAMGASEDEAMARSLEEFPDWRELHSEICMAEEQGGVMNLRTRVYWFPMLAAVSAAVLYFLWIIPAVTAPRIPEPSGVFLLLLAPLALCGAIGGGIGWWLGASRTQRLLAALSPILLIVYAVLLAAVRGKVSDIPNLNSLWYFGGPLLLGAAPFLFLKPRVKKLRPEGPAPA